MSVYQGYDAAQLQAQYDIEATVPDLGPLMERLQRWSDDVRASRPGLLDRSYGDDPLQRLDVFPAGRSGCPIMVYIHGGYWKGGDKGSRAFPAALFNDNGIVWIPINYRLAPAAPLDAIVADARAALSWIYHHADEFGGDRARISVAGSSAGGHLTAMLLSPGWHGSFGLPADIVKGACLMSGLYDLSPFLLTGKHSYLGLDAAATKRNSPIHQLPEHGLPLVVSWGGKETDEFIRQSTAYAEAWNAKGYPLECFPMPDEDHFSLMGEMGRAESPLARAMLDLALAR